jgi:hypothetical protein
MRVLVPLLVASTLVLGPGLADAVHAEPKAWSFSWNSTVFGRLPAGEPFRTEMSGRATAHLAVTAATITVTFDTPFGTAHAAVDRETLGFTTSFALPFNVPDELDGHGRDLYAGEVAVAQYHWSGDIAAPEAFMIEVTLPGSGPSPEFRFVGTGTREVFTAWLTAPANGATVTGTVTVRARSDGGTGPTRTMHLYVDGEPYATRTVAAEATAAFTLNTASLARGTHTLSVHAVDGSGTEAVDTHRITVTHPTRPGVSFSVTSNQTVRGSTRVTIGVNGLAAGAKRYRILVDGRQVGFRVITAATTVWWWNTGAYANGTHTVAVRVVDVNGREANGSVRTVIANQ